MEKEIADILSKERWLIIVWAGGKVETIYKLNQNAEVIGTVRI